MSTVMGTLDSKGRVCIPAAYRQILSAQNTSGVYICPSFFENALAGFGQSVLDGLHTRLSALDPFLSVAHDDTAYAIISRTQLLPADEQGRVRRPDALIDHEALTAKSVFLGLSPTFLVSPD